MAVLFFNFNGLELIITSVAVGVVFAFGILSVVLSAIRGGKTVEKLSVIFFSFGISGIDYCITGKLITALLVLSVGVAFFGINLLINKKEKPIKEVYKQIPLKKLIDDSIKSDFPEEENNCEIIRAKKSEDEKPTAPPELDFSHIKGVIERINTLSLNAGDKKAVRDLEICVNNAERGDTDRETKERINEGLGALLKIMSKYGV